MAEAFKNIMLMLLTEQCFDEYFIKFNFLDTQCLKATISKGLGLGIIAGSLLVKVPQIVKILQNKSGEGLNIYAIFLDLAAMTATVSYSLISGFPFSAWGDGIFLTIQTVTVGLLVLYYGGNKSGAGLFMIIYSAICVVLMGGFTPLEVLWFFQACNIPLVLGGKVIQAVTNFNNKSTGQLSAVTCTMLCFGSLARIFTSIQETGDAILVISYCVASFTNCFIAGQLLWYWNSDKEIKEKKAKKD